MKYRLLFSIFVLSFVLGACASIIDKQTQIVTVRTPGAVDAKCILENPDMKYSLHTDQTMEIMKSPYDLVVRCMAPGNREKTILVKREVNEWVFLNVSNGFVLGTAYDYFSRGAFDYPEEIIVDFVGMPLKSYPLPAYHQDGALDVGVRQPLERYGSGEVYSEENRYDPPYQIQKIEHNRGRSDFDDPNAPIGSMDNIHRQYNPHVSGGTYDPSEEDK